MISMHTYIKLKDGRTMLLWSDNTEEETMLVYPVELAATFNCEWDDLEEVPYSDVLVLDGNRSIVERF